jgi:aspartate/methionine/tyrosine aminotransferase
MAIEPDERQLQEVAAIAASDEDGPVVMLNLNRYRDREAYMRYGIVAAEVIAVWYPSYAAFLALVNDPELQRVREHRVAGLERAAVVCCPGNRPVMGATMGGG